MKTNPKIAVQPFTVCLWLDLLLAILTYGFPLPYVQFAIMWYIKLLRLFSYGKIVNLGYQAGPSSPTSFAVDSSALDTAVSSWIHTNSYFLLNLSEHEILTKI